MFPLKLLLPLYLLHSFAFAQHQQPVNHDEYTRDVLRFDLRHYHAVTREAKVLFHDVTSDETYSGDGRRIGRTTTIGEDHTSAYNLQTRRIKSRKPRSFDAYIQARRRSYPHLYSSDSDQEAEAELFEWDDEEAVIAPDTESRETLLQLAKMTNNAYLEPGEAGWYDLDGKWNVSYPFGWEPDQDGFRGHVFATPDNSTVVLSIKGTSATFVGGGGPTSKKDKFNDNLLFSCCCARIDWTWTTVCDCYRGGYRCDQGCLEQSLVDDSLFYPIGTNLYNNLTYMYPDSTIWVTGHSLGGALASLLGVTFGAPAVAFESPGEKMAAGRLHLLLPPSLQHVTHVYHTADPIAMGTCNGVFSSCALGGYAMESRCHLGKQIVYDTVSNLSWAVDIRTHSIGIIIERLLSEPWAPSMEEGREVPKEREEDEGCVECFSWEFGDFPPEDLLYVPYLYPDINTSRYDDDD
ncbi:alpha/beta-hydrolase [Panus rudis PR-1116 ss-1]|nr:alpha/beta-hydrolase [Panus rudis PR-1116 ss-1]